MLQIRIILGSLFLFGIMTASFADGVPSAGYVYTPSSGSTTVKTSYGQCLHTAYWSPADGTEECGEAPEKPEEKKYVTKVTSFMESDTQLFSFNSPSLSTAGQAKLDGFLTNLAKTSAAIHTVTIRGYTDMIGGADYNLRLSQERADAIKSYFVEHGGLNADTIVAEGMGMKNASASPDCFKKYGKDDLPEINRLTAREKTQSREERKKMDEDLRRFEEQHKELVACASPDRRVEITIEETKQEEVLEK